MRQLKVKSDSDNAFEQVQKVWTKWQRTERNAEGIKLNRTARENQLIKAIDGPSYAAGQF